MGMDHDYRRVLPDLPRESPVFNYGEIEFPFGLAKRKVFAGPYRRHHLAANDHPGMLRIKLAQEINEPCDLEIPIVDFGIPEDVEVVGRVLAHTLAAMAYARPVYVGCMGGIGRTGTFLALLAKTLGIEQPVKYVRKHYLGHAVERDQQHEYIRAFTPEVELRKALLKAKLTAGYVDVAKRFGLPLTNRESMVQ